MKAKRFLALALALVMSITCMSVTAFADATSYAEDITISVTPEIGDTPATLISKAVLSDSTNLEITEARIFDTGYTSLDSIATSGTYNIAMTVKLNNYTAFAVSSGDYTGEFTLEGLKCNMFDVCYGWDIDEEMPKTEPYQNHTTISYLVFDAEITLYDATLDLEEGDDYLDTRTGIEQKYNVTVVDGTKTGKTKVQVSWKLEDIAVSVTNNKVWNTETLTWDTDTSKTNGATASDPTAEFNFVNFSSKDVDAQVTFAKAAGITNEPTQSFTDNNGTAGAGDGIITLGNKATSAATDNTGKVALKLTITDSDFDNVSAGTGTYGTYTVTISPSKKTQTAPATPTKASATATSVTLNTATAGKGATKYAYNTSDSAPETGWQDTAEFTGLTANTTYYFFVKYVGNSEYKEAVSEALAVTTLSASYALSTSLSSNVTADGSNPTEINTGSTATLVFTPDSGCTFASTLPNSAVTGADVKSWNATTGTLVLENATADVSITLQLPVVNPPYVADDYLGDGMSVGTSISITATGTNLSYQWYEYSDNDYTPKVISGATTNASVLGGNYTSRYCIVTNEYGSARSISWYND